MYLERVFYNQSLYSICTFILLFLLQASSDLSILDYNVPFSTIFVVAASIELLTTIGIMASVTWELLIVAILAMVAAKYVQVDLMIHI